ncbi:uncharacterized protein DNG_10282 [Cephalotrichum gorgonifer]|uniref:Uncharacterized protein n=1 Tax=Cephalotrichum gorgonifer TaxID=2041049 RepID=A0AAE8N964_9PEZI|nr:uncharacterized protein DNG_10282 [Cephalotrichum gorgonifer]
MSGYPWVFFDGSPNDESYRATQGQGDIPYIGEYILTGETYNTIPQNAGMAGPPFAFVPRSCESISLTSQDVPQWPATGEQRLDTLYPTSQNSIPRQEIEVFPAKMHGREGTFPRRTIQSGDAHENPTDKVPIPPRPRSSPGLPSSSPVAKQFNRLFCCEREPERATQPRSARRRAAASAPPDALSDGSNTSRPGTLSSTPGKRGQLRELRVMRLLPDRPGRRRRARISSEYCSSSGVYTPLYPSPIEYFYTPTSSSMVGLRGARGRSKSDVLHFEAARGDLSGGGGEGELSDGGGRAQGPHHGGYAAGGGGGTGRRRRRRRRRRSVSKLTEVFPMDDDDTGPESRIEDRGGSEGATTPVGREESTSGGTMIGRRILRRNSTGTMRVMDMESWGYASKRSGS